ncbi:hypothetical protein Tco_0308919 [Tanacetum coccineum]
MSIRGDEYSLKDKNQAKMDKIEHETGKSTRFRVQRGILRQDLVPKSPDSSQRPPQDYVKCGNPVEGPSCQGCALWRKKLKEVWFTIFVMNWNLHDLSESLTTSSDVDSTLSVNESLAEHSLSNRTPCEYHQSEGFSDSNDDSTLIDDDSFAIDDIDYVESSPPDFELVSLDVVEIIIPEVGGIDTDILLTVKDDILCKNLLNVNLLIAKIEALKDNLTPSSDFVSNEPDSGNFTMDVVEDISDNPTRELYVHVHYDLPTHPTLQLDSDFTLSSDSLGSDLVVSSPSGDRNKIYDPGICIEVESTRSLATLSPVIDTLLPFSSKNEDKVFNHGVLALNEKSSPSLSHRGFKASKLFHHKSPMLIQGENTPILDVPFLHLYPP